MAAYNYITPNATTILVLLVTVRVAASYAAGDQAAGSDILDVEEFVESSFAPFLAYDGGHLYISQNKEGKPVVCGSIPNATPPMVFPVTLRKLESLHSHLLDTYSGETEPLELNMVEGCYVTRDKDGSHCVVPLTSFPEDCGMSIDDSTAFWAHRIRERKSTPTTMVLKSRAAILAEDILRVQMHRERLRHAIWLNREFNRQGAELYEVARRGWNANADEENKRAFRMAVSAKASLLVKSAHIATMKKWAILKEWMKTSVGEVDRELPTYTSEDNGTLLPLHAHCGMVEELDELLHIADRPNYMDNLFQRLYAEMRGFTYGTLMESKEDISFPHLNHLPCVAVSLSVTMLLQEDFPVRLMYQNITGERGTSNLWPWRRFEELKDATSLVYKHRKYTATQVRATLNATANSPEYVGIFGGGSWLANCVVRAISRADAEDGTPPPPSLFDCYSPTYNSSRWAPGAGGNNSLESHIPGEKRKYRPLYLDSCSWGFTRASGNAWDKREPCVRCPPGSFGDGRGGCECRRGFYLTRAGCRKVQHRIDAKASWKWLAKTDRPSVAVKGGEKPKPLVIVYSSLTTFDGDKVKVTIKCAEGLTEFIAFPSSTGDTSQGKYTKIPVGRDTYIYTTREITIALSTSAAFGGERCNISTRVTNPKYNDSPDFHAGSFDVLPPLATLRITALPHTSTPAEGATVRQLPRCSGTLKGGAWRLIKQAVREDEGRATELGEMLKLLSQRLRLAATIAFKRSGGGTKVEEAFNGLIKPRYSGEVYPIGHTNVAEVRVWLKIVDFCTTKEGKAYPYCRDKKPIFDRSKVSHAVFFLASDGEATNENPSGKEDEGPGNQNGTAEGTPEDRDSGRHGEATETTNETREETISPGEGDEDAQEGTDAYDPNGSGWVSDEEEETGAEGDPEDEERGGGDNEDHHGETKGTKEKGAQGFRFWNDWGPLRIPIAAVGAVDMVLLFFNSLLFTVYWFGMR